MRYTTAAEKTAELLRDSACNGARDVRKMKARQRQEISPPPTPQRPVGATMLPATTVPTHPQSEKTDIHLTPVRIQRSRRKGARLESPNGLPVVCCTRPNEWGNPFKVGAHVKLGTRDKRIGGGPFGGFIYLQSYAPQEGFHTIKDAAEAVEWYRRYLLEWRADDARRELRGKNLACWCAPGKPCHADVLLEVANSPTAEDAE